MRFMKGRKNPPSSPAFLFNLHLIRQVLCVSLFLLGITDLEAGTNLWSKVGPEVAHVSAIGISRSSHDILYVGTAYTGVQKSLNGGQTWGNTSLMSQNVTAVMVDPSNSDLVYAGAVEGGVFRSLDGGDSWKPIKTGLNCPNGSLNVYSLALDGANPGTLYAGTGCGVFKSTNGGGAWQAPKSTLDGDARALAIDPSDPTTLYAGTSKGSIFRSTDGGTNWISAKSGQPVTSVNALVVDPSKTNTIYAGSGGGGVYKSTNSGADFTRVNQGLTNRNVNALAVDYSVADTLYAGTSAGVYKSTNGGANWTASNQGLTTPSCNALAIDPVDPHILYAAVSQGMAKSTDGAADWSYINAGLVDVEVSALAMPAEERDTIYAATRGDCVFRSSNNGEIWVSHCSASNNPVIAALVIDPLDPDTIYAGTSGDGILKSADGGLHWDVKKSGLTDLNIRALAVDPTDSNIVYAGGVSQGVFKSADGGTSWIGASAGLTNPQVNALAIDPEDPNRLLAGTNGGIFRSVNGGTSWSASSIGLGSSSVHSLAIDPTNSRTVYAGSYTVFRSDHGGVNWIPCENGLTGTVYALAIESSYSPVLYAGTDAGFFKSVNKGNNWVQWNPGIEDMRVNALAIDPSDLRYLYSGTDGYGVFSIFLQPRISITSPNGGENLPAVTSQKITWTTEGPVGNVRIKVSIDGGTSYTTVANSVPNTGSYSWTVSSVLSPNCLVQVSEVGGDATDTSVGMFSIVGCSYSIAPASQVFDTGGGTGSVTVSALGGCSWTASSNAAWVAISSGANGNGNGTVNFTVSSNSSPSLRTGTLNVAGQTFTITQAGSSAGCGYTVTPLRQSFDSNGGSNTVNVAATSSGCSWVAISNVPWITIDSGASGSGNGRVGFSVAANSDISGRVGTVSLAGQTLTVTQAGTVLGTEVTLFVPIVLSATGLNDSFYTSELTLTNRGSTDADVTFNYTGAFGGGSGTAKDSLPAGQQRIVPNAIQYLRSLGVPIPSSSSVGGTLSVSFSGIISPSDAGVTVRTTTTAGNGRAGLAYAGIARSSALNGPAYLCGLRQNAADRSNVAFQNVGSASEGDITLQVTVYSGDGSFSKPLPDVTLTPGGFSQITQVLSSNGLSLPNGYVRVARKTGAAPYFAYGVINDQGNSDGSFVPPQLEASGVVAGMTLPVIVEASPFSSELVVTNWSAQARILHFEFVSEAIQASDKTARFNRTLRAGEQEIISDLIQSLREQEIEGIGPFGTVYAGALFVTAEGGDSQGVFVGARTSAPGGGGRFGLFYAGVPYGTASTTVAWIYGLQQNTENRTNLALVNTGETDSSQDILKIELFNGVTGQPAGTIDQIPLGARRWLQIGAILAQYAPGVTQGYARVSRVSGSNPLIAYGVINDGSRPNERTGDGAFLVSFP